MDHSISHRLMLHPPQAVLFDCDGVLVDSEPALAEIAALALQDYGAPAKPDDFKPYIGTGEDTYLGRVAEQYGLTYSDAIKLHVYEKYGEQAERLVQPFPGVRDLLRQLQLSGLRLAVASSADWVKVETNLRALDMPEGTFDAIITGSDIQRKKPFPDIYLLAAERTRSEPARCIVVEDAVSGVAAGKSAGMTVIGFTSAHTAEELLAAGADIIVDEIGEIEALLRLHG